MTLRRAFAATALVAGLGGLLAAGTGGAGPVAAQDSAYGGLPEGKNRVLVFGVCSGCHSVKMVMQQGMSRAKWDATLDWMVEQQGMPELDPETESKVLDYLAEHFNTDHRPGGGTPSPYHTMQPMTSVE